MEKQRVKTYVPVNLRVDEAGAIEVKSIEWVDPVDGKKEYPVDFCGKPQQKASMKCGGTGMCYPIRIGNRDTKIWEEEGRWFVEGIVK